MTDCAKKHLIYLVTWSLWMLFILLHDFSLIMLGVLATLAVISLCKNVLCDDDKLAEYICFNIRYYIIISTLFIECVYIIGQWNADAFVYVVNNFELLTEEAYERILYYCSENTMFLLVAVILSALNIIIREKLIKYIFIHTLLKYQFTVLFCFVLSYAVFDNIDLGVLYILFAVLFIVGDTLRRIYSDDKPHFGKAGRRVFGLLGFILIISGIINPQIAEQLEQFDFNIIVDILSRSSVFLLSFFSSLTVFVSITLIEIRSEKGYAYDKIVLLTTTSIVPVVFVCTKICVGYRADILIFYFICTILALVGTYKRVFNDKHKFTLSDCIPVPILSLSTIFLMLEAQYGKALIAVVLLVSTWIAALTLDVIKEKQLSYATTTVLSWFYVNTLPRLWLYHHHPRVYIIISVIFVIFLLSILVVTRNENIYEKNNFVEFGQFVLPLLFLTLALVIFVRGGSNIDVYTEDNCINVLVEAEDENNSISEAKYCFINDLSEFALDIINEDCTDYISFTSSAIIERKNGLLKIIVVDRNGIRTVKKQWYSSGN